MTIQSLLGPENTPLLACSPDDHLMTAVGRMVSDRANAVAVTTAAGNLAGILSDQDIIRALHAGAGSVANAIVETWMTRNVITVTPETKLADAVRLMASNQIRHVVVVDNARRPIAVVGVRAILRELHAMDEMEINVLRDMAVARR